MGIWKLILLTLVFAVFESKAQTAGIGEVTVMETKAKAIESNKASIERYKTELISLEEEWRKKLKALKEELDALYKERDNLIADMKVGARCSQCKGWKSEFEKKGVNFEAHLGEVKGYAIPATTSELESIREQFKEKIAYKKVQIQNLEKGNNAVTKKKADIAELEKTNDKLCKEITGHSKNYETKVIAESQPFQKNLIEDIMGQIARKHIAEDKMEIGKNRLTALQSEFGISSAEARQIESDSTKFKRVRAEGLVDANHKQLKEEENTYKASFTTITTETEKLKADLKHAEEEMKNLKLGSSEREQFSTQHAALLESLSTKLKEKQAMTNQYTQLVTRLKNDNIELNRQINQLITGLPVRQERLVGQLKTEYERRKALVNQNIRNATNELDAASNLLNQKLADNRRKHAAYMDMIVTECNRMLTVSKQTGCSIFNEVRFTVMGKYQTQENCANGFKFTKARNYPSSGVDCVANSQAYSNIYRAFAAGLSTEEVEAIKKSTYWIWFESFYK
ncbi:MAG: hypothetical protein JWP69_1612 [Flaviaesturariibacter sp.]|nr:hypothetical protein [Flaviaesturariibacter sp.]